MAGANGVSGLQIRDVPQGVGHRTRLGGVSYLVDLLAAFLLPDFGKQLHAFTVILCAIAEIGMVAYLLVWGAAAEVTEFDLRNRATPCAKE